MAKILVEHSPSPMKLEVLNVDDWPIVREPSGMIERHYDQTETSYIAEGEGVIHSEDGDTIEFYEGDMITILPDTSCRWNITEPIERHYYKG